MQQARLLLILWTAMILFASGDAFSARETGRAFALFGIELPFLVHILLRKLMHLVAYGIEGFLALRATRSPGMAILIALAVALIDEFHQSVTMTRSGSPWDVLLDLIGATLAVWTANKLQNPVR